MRKITEIAKVIRSKNSSPFELTLDIILKDREEYEKLKAGNVINAKLIAKAYEIPVERIKKGTPWFYKIACNRSDPSFKFVHDPETFVM